LRQIFSKKIKIFLDRDPDVRVLVKPDIKLPDKLLPVIIEKNKSIEKLKRLAI